MTGAMDRFVKRNNTDTCVLLDGKDGAQLVEDDFQKYSELITTVVSQTNSTYEIEPPIMVRGMQCRQRRDVQFRSDMSKGYFYSNQVMKSQSLTAEMKQLLDIINEKYQASYNGILFNRYKNGRKTVGAHADSEAGLNKHAGVVAISFGAQRKFRIRDKNTNAIVGDYTTRHMRAMQMKGPFQAHYLHEIPAQAKVEGERVSLTFREHDLVAEARLLKRKRD